MWGQSPHQAAWNIQRRWIGIILSAFQRIHEKTVRVQTIPRFLSPPIGGEVYEAGVWGQSPHQAAWNIQRRWIGIILSAFQRIHSAWGT